MTPLRALWIVFRRWQKAVRTSISKWLKLLAGCGEVLYGLSDTVLDFTLGGGLNAPAGTSMIRFTSQKY